MGLFGKLFDSYSGNDSFLSGQPFSSNENSRLLNQNVVNSFPKN
jgi:hypothetical protein